MKSSSGTRRPEEPPRARQRLDLLCGQVELHPVRPDAPHPLDLDESRLAEYVQRDREPGEDVRVRVAHDLRDLPHSLTLRGEYLRVLLDRLHATCGSPPLPSPPAELRATVPRSATPAPGFRRAWSSDTTRRTATRPVIASASSRSKQRRAIPAEIP